MFEESGTVLVVSPLDPMCIHAESDAIYQFAKVLDTIGICHQYFHRHWLRMMIKVLKSKVKPQTNDCNLEIKKEVMLLYKQA